MPSMGKAMGFILSTVKWTNKRPDINDPRVSKGQDSPCHFSGSSGSGSSHEDISKVLARALVTSAPGKHQPQSSHGQLSAAAAWLEFGSEVSSKGMQVKGWMWSSALLGCCGAQWEVFQPLRDMWDPSPFLSLLHPSLRGKLSCHVLVP